MTRRFDLGVVREGWLHGHFGFRRGVRNLHPHFGALHLQRHASFHSIACLRDAHLGGADLSIHRGAAALGGENGVLHLFRLERNLVFLVFHTASIARARRHPRAPRPHPLGS